MHPWTKPSARTRRDCNMNSYGLATNPPMSADALFAIPYDHHQDTAIQEAGTSALAIQKDGLQQAARPFVHIGNSSKRTLEEETSDVESSGLGHPSFLADDIDWNDSWNDSWNDITSTGSDGIYIPAITNIDDTAHPRLPGGHQVPTIREPPFASPTAPYPSRKRRISKWTADESPSPAPRLYKRLRKDIGDAWLRLSLSVLGLDPMHWDVEEVVFALTDPHSIDMRSVSSLAFLILSSRGPSS